MMLNDSDNDANGTSDDIVT